MVNRKISFKIASILLAISIASQANAISFSGIRKGITNAYSSTVDRAQKLYKKHPKRVAAGAAAGTFAAVTGAALFAQKLLCKKVQELPTKVSFLSRVKGSLFSKNTLIIGGALVTLSAAAYAIWKWRKNAKEKAKEEKDLIKALLMEDEEDLVPTAPTLNKDEFNKFKQSKYVNEICPNLNIKKKLTKEEIEQIDQIYLLMQEKAKDEKDEKDEFRKKFENLSYDERKKIREENKNKIDLKKLSRKQKIDEIRNKKIKKKHHSILKSIEEQNKKIRIAREKAKLGRIFKIKQKERKKELLLLCSKKKHKYINNYEHFSQSMLEKAKEAKEAKETAAEEKKESSYCTIL